MVGGSFLHFWMSIILNANFTWMNAQEGGSRFIAIFLSLVCKEGVEMHFPVRAQVSRCVVGGSARWGTSTAPLSVCAQPSKLDSCAMSPAAWPKPSDSPVLCLEGSPVTNLSANWRETLCMLFQLHQKFNIILTFNIILVLFNIIWSCHNGPWQQRIF